MNNDRTVILTNRHAVILGQERQGYPLLFVRITAVVDHFYPDSLRKHKLVLLFISAPISSFSDCLLLVLFVRKKKVFGRPCCSFLNITSSSHLTLH